MKRSPLDATVFRQGRLVLAHPRTIGESWWEWSTAGCVARRCRGRCPSPPQCRACPVPSPFARICSVPVECHRAVVPPAFAFSFVEELLEGKLQKLILLGVAN